VSQAPGGKLFPGFPLSPFPDPYLSASRALVRLKLGFQYMENRIKRKKEKEGTDPKKITAADSSTLLLVSVVL